MEKLLIEKTNYIPQIDFDPDTGVFNISGKSYPENTFEIYKPVNEWLHQYFNSTSNEKTTINLELTYLNSSSLKAYFDIFDIFDNAHNEGKGIEINWIYEEDDDIMEEIGEDFQDDFENLNINLKAKE